MILLKIKNLFLLCCLLFVVNINYAITKQPEPKLVILFIIDGLSVEGPARINMPNFNALKAQGSYYKEMHLTLPGHPEKSNTYPWSCSMPNPMLMTGSPFIGKSGIRESMIQHAFKDKETAFIVNARAYEDVSDGFGTYISSSFNPDALVINLTKEVMDVSTPKFMRVHLQRSGIEGLRISKSWSKNEVYHRNIWHEQSTYRKAITEADRQLGRFVQYLKDSDKWEHTVLLITSDHGQSNEGWHEPYSPPSSVTPLLVVGAGVKKGATFEQSPEVPKNMKRLNKVLIEAHNLPEDKKKTLTNNGFLALEDLGIWHTTAVGDNFDRFVEQQEKLLKEFKEKP